MILKQFISNLHFREWRNWQLASAEFSIQAYVPSLWQEFCIELPELIEKSVEKRQAEHLAGRYLVKELQRQLDIHQATISNAADRSPIWPQGSSGSISHSRGSVWAGLSQNAEMSLGLDVEQFFTEKQVRELGGQLLSNEEMQWLRNQSLPLSLAYALAFAGKESLYKALYPDCQQLKEFTAAQVIGVSSTQIELRLTEDWSSNWSAGQSIIMDYWQSDEMVWVACEVTRRSRA